MPSSMLVVAVRQRNKRLFHFWKDQDLNPWTVEILDLCFSECLELFWIMGWNFVPWRLNWLGRKDLTDLLCFVSGTAWRYCPLRPSTCSSTTAAWPACLSPWLRCTRTTRTTTASSTWPTPRRRCLVTDRRPPAIAAHVSLFLLYVSFNLVFKKSPAAVNRKQAVCIYCNIGCICMSSCCFWVFFFFFVRILK